MSEVASFESAPSPDRKERISEVVQQTRATLDDLRHGIEAKFTVERDPLVSEEVLRRTIAERATGYVGKVFEEGKNRGRDLVQFMPDGQTGKAWCAAFATFCLEQAYVASGVPIEQRLFSTSDRMNLLSARALMERTKKAGSFRTTEPKVGDLVFFRANTKSGVHVALVTDATSTSFRTAEGNVDAQVGVGRREGVGGNTYRFPSRALLGFASPVATSAMVHG